MKKQTKDMSGYFSKYNRLEISMGIQIPCYILTRECNLKHQLDATAHLMTKPKTTDSIEHWVGSRSTEILPHR